MHRSLRLGLSLLAVVTVVLATGGTSYAHQAGTGTMRAGMVLAIEPGMYWDGGGGLRVEDNWLITDGAPERLCSFPDGIVRA